MLVLVSLIITSLPYCRDEEGRVHGVAVGRVRLLGNSQFGTGYAKESLASTAPFYVQEPYA